MSSQSPEGMQRAQAEALANQGISMLNQGHNAEGIALLHQAVASDETWAEPVALLGNVLRRLGQLDEAVTVLLRAVALEPGLAAAHNDLGAAYHGLGNIDGALASFETAVGLSPDDPLPLYNLGSTLKLTGALGKAVECLRRVVTMQPDDPDAHLNLGNGLKDQGNIDEAVKCYKRAIVLRPQAPAQHSNLLLAECYRDKLSIQERYVAHREWAAVHAGQQPQPMAYTGGADDPIRVGYVSPDFRSHSVAYFIEPILRKHNRDRVFVVAYAQVARPDAVTKRIAGLVDKICYTTALSDSALAEQIQLDKIDVLVDLAGHTAGNRLPLFGCRPAPLQITYLGYPETTGLAAIDLRITDAWADPDDGRDTFYSEHLVRLPGGFLCYQPDVNTPEINPLPAMTASTITFGSFNAVPKLSEKTIATWAALLQAVPRSRLLLKSPSFGDEATRNRILDCFADQGIASSRISCLSYVEDSYEHLQTYHQVDIGLDTFPYCGTTTTCEALWMGVPVITLVGERHVERVGYSLMNQVGLREFCASDTEEYVAIAKRLASDLDSLASIRMQTRTRMEYSPLCDADRIAGGLEQVYREGLARIGG